VTTHVEQFEMQANLSPKWHSGSHLGAIVVVESKVCWTPRCNAAAVNGVTKGEQLKMDRTVFALREWLCYGYQQ
jgi:hypothetical protein